MIVVVVVVVGSGFPSFFDGWHMLTPSSLGRAFHEVGASSGGGEEAGEEDPLVVLGLPPGSSAEAVRKRYLNLISRCHPDKPGGSRARFDEVQEAYEKALREAHQGGRRQQ